MLKELRIKNLAIIDDLRLRFEAGLNVLTGETGAGKSILVDALSLVLGSRAQSDLVRSGEKEAIIQAYFEIDGIRMPDIGLDISEGLILRRYISASGKSKAYINDIMVSMQSLAEIGKKLVDIHGQHEHQSLLSLDMHREFLDAFGRLKDDRERVSALYTEVSLLDKELIDLKKRLKDRAQRIDLLRFQIQEIDSAVLKVDEKEKLLEERAILSNLSKLNELAETAYSMIYGDDDSCIEKLSVIISKVKEIAAIDQNANDILSMLEEAMPLIEDASNMLRRYKNRYDLEPVRLEEVETRLDLIKKLEKKYGEGIMNIISYKEGAEKELKSLGIIDERVEALESELKIKEEMLINAARSLSGKRQKTALIMKDLIEKEFKELAFSDAQFFVDLKEESLAPHGIDRVEFKFTANLGEPPKPLAKIASGGELSRVMLALKSILSDFDSIPVLIFDEVDAGIGGKTAHSVARKLKALSSKHQVLCTTHLPQIASVGDFHLKTEKKQKGEKVYVEVKELKDNERMKEIARMLGGTITDVSLKHAKELLERSI